MLLRASTVSRQCARCGNLVSKRACRPWAEPDGSELSRAAEAVIGARCLAATATPSAAAHIPPEPHTASWRGYALAGATAAAAGGWAWQRYQQQAAVSAALPTAEEGAHLVNWSATHEIRPRRLFQPETQAELEALVASHHSSGTKLRPVGSALSPNGLGFADDDQHDMVSLSLMDRVLEVDRVSGRARVQAGARIADVVEALRPHDLALQNIASIREQAMGGFVQVGAHGTGAQIPPMDEQVVALTLVTPGRGTLHLSQDDADPSLFYLARVGLGSLGVVSEVTLQAVPSHQLLEHTFVSSLKEIKKKHTKWLRDNRHMRYMWIPHTDAVVVVTNNPLPEGRQPPKSPASHSESEKTAAFQRLLQEVSPDVTPEEVATLAFSQLRDELLAKGGGPLDKAWVARVNAAEADFWRRNSGYRVGRSDELLSFDCGGQQWVLENAFPVGTLRDPSGADISYMEELLAEIEKAGIGAPAPIEQRWCGRSRSAMSPAAATDPDALTSWVGIIMYLPEEGDAQRAAITDKFRDYAAMVDAKVAARHGAVPHWAKVEVPEHHPGDRRDLRARLAAHYPVARFAEARKALDPRNILSNRIVDTLLPRDGANP